MKNTWLCGGVFFFLITQAAYTDRSRYVLKAEKKEDHSDPALMDALIDVFAGDGDITTDPKDVSRYKECLSEGGVNVPFNDATLISDFNGTVKGDYDKAIEQMNDFVTRHIDPNKKEWLVKALLELVENDDEIKETDSFYIERTGLPVTKERIRSMTEFDLEPFLIGILYYILQFRNGQNRKGRQTLEELGMKQAHRERVYTGNPELSINRKIVVNSYPFPEPTEKTPSQSASSFSPGKDQNGPDSTDARQTGQDQGTMPPPPSSTQNLTFIQTQINIGHSETKNVTIDHSTVTLNL